MIIGTDQLYFIQQQDLIYDSGRTEENMMSPPPQTLQTPLVESITKSLQRQQISELLLLLC